MRKAYLASIVPVIINAILNEHQIVADIVAFVGKGDFPRSRLGEKQRGKILASWVTRKMRTIAQFSIRDPESEEAMSAVPEDRVAGPASLNRGSFMTTSERPISSNQQQQALAHRFSGAEDPNYVAEQNLPYESSIVESPPAAAAPDQMPQAQNDNTPIGQAAEYFPPPAGREMNNQPPQISPAKQQQPLSHGISKDYFAHISPAHDPDRTPLAPEIRHQGVYEPRDQVYSGYDDNYDENYDGAFDDNYAATPLYAKQEFIDLKQTYLEPRRTAYGSANANGDSGPAADNNKYVAYHPSLGGDIGAPVTPEYGQRAEQIGVADGGDDGHWPQEAIMHIRRHGN